MAEIPPDELDARLAGTDVDESADPNADTPFVLDIRHEDEYEDWHIPGSVNVDVYDELKDDPESADDALAKVPDDREVVTVCAAGVLSQTATERLRELGHDAKTLVDGMAGWSRVHRHAPVDVVLDGTLVQVARPGKGCLSYVLVSDGEAVVVDPSQFADEYESILDQYDASLVGVYDTHAHADHVSGGRTLADRNDVPYHLHPADDESHDATAVSDGETIAVGDVTVEVVHTPGHSPGGVTYAVEDVALLTGDTLFHESVGRVELGVEAGMEDATAADNADTLYDSLRRIRERGRAMGDPLVLPAHDPGAPDPPVVARLSDVVEHNDDLGRSRDAFIAELAADVPEHPPNFRQVKRLNVGAADPEDADLADLEVGPNRCAAE